MTRNSFFMGRCLLRALLLALLIYGSLATTSLAHADNRLSLAEATRLAIAHNPQLESWRWQLKQLQSDRDTAALGPALKLGVEVENVLGNGPSSNFEGGETTLALSSVLRLGNQKDAQVNVATTRLDLASTQKRAELLSLLGNVTRRYIELLALQERQILAEKSVTLASQALTSVSHAVSRGAAPSADKLQAMAALEQAKLNQTRLANELQAAHMALASLWGEASPKFSSVSGSLTRLTPSQDFEQLYQRVLTSPINQLLSQEGRLKEAQWQLAKSQSSLDVDWQLGVRRMAATDSNALVFGVAVPLFSGKRNQSEVKAAHFARLSQQEQADSKRLELRATLFHAWQNYRSNRQAVLRLQETIIPQLEEASRLAEKAYVRGLYRYSDWDSARQKLLAAETNLIVTGSDALLNQALIEELTGTALNAESNATN